MNRSKNVKLWLSSLFIFAAFFVYFAAAAKVLPDNAGPDYPFSRAAADFYLENGRLATIPKDEAMMEFSRYGNSRLLRPPVGYATAAMFAKTMGLSKADGNERFYAYRLANAFFGALTVAAIFAGVFLFFNSAYLALLGALLVGLLPQFTFTSVYLNDDSAAILAVTLLTLIMVVITKGYIAKGHVTLRNCVLFALAIGFAVLTKKSAWLFVPSAFLFYCAFILRFDRDFWSKHIAMLVAFILAGGWWFLFNMLHYGWDDPLMSKLMNDVVNRHASYDLTKFGFQAQGIGMRELLLENHRDFIGATYKAVVGHLDWLKIRVGSMQYGFYLLVVAGLLFNIVFLLSDSILKRFKDPLIIVEWILYFSIALQVFLYTWVNVYKDIQVQGKYILPVILPMLLLSLGCFNKLFGSSTAATRYQRTSLFKYCILALILVAPMIVHLDALVDHVIPFYWPQADLGILGKIL